MECLLAAWPSGSEGRFYDGHVHKVGGSLPPKPRCGVLGQDASRQLSLLGGI